MAYPRHLLGRSLIVAVALILGSRACNQQVSAGPVQIRLDGLGAYEVVTIDNNGTYETVVAGQFQMHYVTGPTAGAVFNSFCVDLNHYVSIGQTYLVTPQSTSAGLNQGAAIAYLYDTYGITSINNAQESAALQIAIWDEVQDGGAGLNTGSFRYVNGDPTITSEANSFINAANANAGSATWLNASASGDGLYRGQSVLAPEDNLRDTPSIGGVPEPSTFMLLGLAILSIAACLRFAVRPKPAQLGLP